jgi:hypothetical protein
MSSFVFNLKDGLSNVSNPNGIFRFGSFSETNVFTLFNEYSYTDGTPYTGLPFDATQELAWKTSGQGYPHIGFENLFPNAEISPQPFPVNGIYVHPYVSGAIFPGFTLPRKDVGVRMIIPYTAGGSFVSTVQTAQATGDGTKYRILKNGTEILARTAIVGGAFPVNFTTTDSFIAGDIVDFIVDVGDALDPGSDDTSFGVELTLSYTQIPSPTLSPNPINCNTTQINGVIDFIASGTTANLFNGAILIQSVPVNVVGVNGTFSFTGLNLTAFGGNTLSVILTKAGDTDSTPVTFVVGTVGCASVATATNHSYITPANTGYTGNVSTGNIACGGVEVTSYQIQGNPTNTLPYATTHGQIIAFSQSTGVYTWIPNNNIVGVFPIEFIYEVLCDGVITVFANENVTVNNQTGVLTITNGTGGFSNVATICSQVNTYKANLVFTPAIPAVTPLTYLWTIPTGFTVVSGQGTDTLNLITNVGFSGLGMLSLQVATPFETLNTSIELCATCCAVFDDVWTTPANTTLANANPSLNDTTCNPCCVAMVLGIPTITICV